MLRQPAPTPCPDNFRIGFEGRRESLLSNSETDTTDIDFTTEFRSSLRAAAPRRRQTNIRERKGVGLGFSIHEDEEVKSFPSRSVLKRSPVQVKPASSIMAQPPQRFHPGPGFISDPTRQSLRLGNAGQSDVSTSAANTMKPPVDSRAKKPARRGTIYVPTEDTTMPTMFMGVFSPIKDLAGGHQDGENQLVEDVTGIAAQMAQKKTSRKSLAAAPAKRAPLQMPKRPVQEKIGFGNRPGQKTGKENIPPGSDEAVFPKLEEKKGFSVVDHLHPVRTAQSIPEVLGLARRASIVPASQNTQTAKSDVQAPSRKPVLPTVREPWASSIMVPPVADGTDAVRAPCRGLHMQNTSPMAGNTPHPSSPRKTDNVPMRLSIPPRGHTSVCRQYPLLSDDIVDPSMYEDQWLGHQEIAITQLVNNLFWASSSRETRSGRLVRLELLEMFLSNSFSLLHKRLQASLLYGALSVPKDVLARASRVCDDLGVRRRFLDLWIKTYRPCHLKAAAEVVIGRQCPTTPRTSGTATSPEASRSPKATKKLIETFLETFLIRNEDLQMQPTTSTSTHTANSYRRTLQRSLLLIQLLDRARTASPPLLSGALFLTTSPYKSSISVLQALGTLLLPSHGDLLRPLSHLDYSLLHVQYPLEEYKYAIDNIAVDLRDGVRLTRLVEMLLYPSSTHRQSSSETTTTIVMPAGEVLDLLEGSDEWPLSQHLKFPCLGRATKIFNVQIALSALHGVRGMEKLLDGVTAENIVDGYREKTVGVLWGLLSRWGVEDLVDFGDVKSQIRKIRSRLDPPLDTDENDFSNLEESANDLETNSDLLRVWATVIAQTRGVRVQNLTTSFSDGFVFSAIVDEYAQYLPSSKTPDTPNAPLSARLQTLGCSLQFSQLFTGADKIFDKDTTIAALAFLASRVLGASKRTRAALTIQNAWRSSLALRETRKRIVKRRLAKQCAVVVGVREKVGQAKKTILKAWRLYRERKMCQQGTASDKGLERSIESTDIWLDIS